MLAVENVEFAYGGSSILNGLSLEVRDGEMLGVVGPNGSGKTTLMRLVGGTLTPSNGAIRVDGSDLKDLGPGRRARLVAVVPQNPVLPLGFTVLQLVMLGRNPHLKLLQWEGRHDIEVAEQAMAVGLMVAGESAQVQVAAEGLNREELLAGVRKVTEKGNQSVAQAQKMNKGIDEQLNLQRTFVFKR